VSISSGSWVDNVNGGYYANYSSTGDTIPEIAMPTLPVGTIPNNGSSSLSLQLKAPSGSSNRVGTFTKQYNVNLTGLSSYDFTFEVYGVIAC
jgi:hypothetical protein